MNQLKNYLFTQKNNDEDAVNQCNDAYEKLEYCKKKIGKTREGN